MEEEIREATKNKLAEMFEEQDMEYTEDVGELVADEMLDKNVNIDQLHAEMQEGGIKAYGNISFVLGALAHRDDTIYEYVNRVLEERYDN